MKKEMVEEGGLLLTAECQMQTGKFGKGGRFHFQASFKDWFSQESSMDVKFRR